MVTLEMGFGWMLLVAIAGYRLFDLFPFQLFLSYSVEDKPHSSFRGQ